MKQACRVQFGHSRLIAVMLLALALCATVSAGEFVSYKGQFKITYPDNWLQVDYSTADMRIKQAGGDLTYEAAFASKDDPVVLEGRYFILTVDTVGELSAMQIDSALNGVASDFGRTLKETATDQFLVDLQEDALYYCPQLKMAAIYSRMDVGTPEARDNVVLRKFYEHGVADFYFYSADSVFRKGLDDMQSILMSFTVSDLTPTVSEPPAVGGSDSCSLWCSPSTIIIAAVVVALVVVIWLLKRRKTSH